MATPPKFRRVIPLSHGIDQPETQQAVRQLERLVQELQSALTTYNPTTRADGGSSTASVTSSIVVVDYTATGSEGVDFFVPTGIAMADSNYGVLWAPSGAVAIPVVDLPNAPGDRTSTQFRVLTNAQVSAGDKLTFILFQR